MKAHIRAGAESGGAYRSYTSGHVSNIAEVNTLLPSVENLADITRHIATPPSKRYARNTDNQANALPDQTEKRKTSVRAKVEHSFRVIKRQFGLVKVRE